MRLKIIVQLLRREESCVRLVCCQVLQRLDKGNLGRVIMWIRDKDKDKGNLGRVIIWIRGKDKDKDKDEGNLGRFVIMVVMLVMVIVMLVVMIMLAFEDDDRTETCLASSS